MRTRTYLSFSFIELSCGIVALTGLVVMGANGFDGGDASIGWLIASVGAAAFVFARWLRRECGLTSGK